MNDPALLKLLESIRELERQVMLMLPSVDESAGINHIVTTIAAQHRIPLRDILGSSRKAELVRVRNICIWAVHKLRPELSHSSIGSYFSRDHGTIAFSIRNIENERSINTIVKRTLDSLIENLKPLL
jgi:chromosomal replication initiator protein